MNCALSVDRIIIKISSLRYVTIRILCVIKFYILFISNIIFQVKVNEVEYKPSVASPNKKQAKAVAAQICLQTLGLLAKPNSTTVSKS